MLPIGFPAHQFSCSMFQQETVGQKWKPYKCLCSQGQGLFPAETQGCKIVYHRGQHILTFWSMLQSLHSSCVLRVTSHGNQSVCAGAPHSMGAARGHSQTWESGSTPSYPHMVGALLSEGQTVLLTAGSMQAGSLKTSRARCLRASTALPFLLPSSRHEGVMENNGHFTPLHKAQSGTEIITHNSEFSIFSKSTRENDKDG